MSSDPPTWIHPDQVMQMHRLKMKKRALQARMNKGTCSRVGRDKPSLDITVQHQSGSPNKSLNSSNLLNSSLSSSHQQKRKNPFLKDTNIQKKLKDDSVHTEGFDATISTDSVLFELMKMKPTETNSKQNASLNENSKLLSFSNVLSKFDEVTVDGNKVSDESHSAEIATSKGESYVPIDWTLNIKMRLMSSKPFAWNGKLKTSEQASGTTGFVRCLDTAGEQQTTLDTSPNARFHQCCLVWQHPSLPWIELFPRSAAKITASLTANNSIVTNNQFIKDSLFTEWSDSFRSLFHLLRARQCPYFYVCANSFTALFRAAGICGVSEIHVLLTPTTRGFRQSLRQQEIEFTMPLKLAADRKKKKAKRRKSDGIDDTGYDTLDSPVSSAITSNLNVTAKVDDLKETNAAHDVNDDDNHSDEEDENEEDKDDLLESLGIEDSEIRRINSNQKRITLEKESEVDSSSKESLIFVKGVEAQALFNFLINCKSAVATTGALAGIPPTLLAPVAFHGATLKPLKVRESIVRIDNDKFHSLEIRGPILPHILPSLCFLLTNSNSQLDQFSVSCAQLNSTKSFNDAKHGLETTDVDEKENEKKPQSAVFGQENLSDCGFNNELLSHFCNLNSERIGVVESLRYSATDGYSWS